MTRELYVGQGSLDKTSIFNVYLKFLTHTSFFHFYRVLKYS